MAAWRHGGMAAWRHGGMAAWRRGGMAAWRRGGVAAWRHGGMAAWRHGGTAARRHGGAAAWRRGGVAAWRRGGVAAWRHVWRLSRSGACRATVATAAGPRVTAAVPTPVPQRSSRRRHRRKSRLCLLRLGRTSAFPRDNLETLSQSLAMIRLLTIPVIKFIDLIILWPKYLFEANRTINDFIMIFYAADSAL